MVNYKKAGVDIKAGNEAVNRIKNAVESTYNKNVLSGLGSFGGFFNLDVNKWKNPVLISSTDGVGTKIMVAIQACKYDTIGIDLVNHCVNDIFVHNATPLFFLDYIGTGKLKPSIIEKIISGMVIACKEHNTVLIGGEMAEMPGLYKDKDIEIVGTMIGCAEKENIIYGEKIKKGDIVMGFPSNGLHTNGYTLARHVLFDKLSLDVDDYIGDFGDTLGNVLLMPHKSYYHQLYNIINTDKNTISINGMAHITGGGIPGNLKRIIPDNLYAEIDCKSWEVPSLFRYLEENGEISKKEMFSAFNMGIGFIAVVPEDSVDEMVAKCASIPMGVIKIQDNEDEKVKLVNNK